MKATMSTVVNEKEIQEEKTEIKTESVTPKQFLKEVRAEFVKITWPSREQVTREFFSVILLVAFLTGIILMIDKVYEFIVNFFSGRIY